MAYGHRKHWHNMFPVTTPACRSAALAGERCSSRAGLFCDTFLRKKVTNPQRKLLASYDDVHSVQLKTEYVLKHRLNRIMFWQLAEDKLRDGFLDAIDKAKRDE